MPTTAATTLRKARSQPLVIDGPFAETKEQLLGFYIVDCDISTKRSTSRANCRANPGRRLRDPAVGLFRSRRADPA